jgi:hypothetical protein
MKKIYLLSCTVLMSSVLMAQSIHSVQTHKRPTSREESAPMVPNRVEPTAHGDMRNVLLEENFQTSGATPGSLPTGWTTNDVAQTQGTTATTDDDTGPAFKVHNSTSANAGGYWPVTEVGSGNKFAGANDDNVPCDCDMTEVHLEAPAVDFSAATYPAITFDIYHDGNFGGGDAWVEISTDAGATWTMIPNPADVDGFLPIEEGNWQTIVLTLFDYSGVTDARLRFVWSDNGSWASGFGVDNVVIGDLENNSLTLDKVVYGDWNNATFGLGFWDYSQIPLSQVDVVRSTSVVTNTGYYAQPNVAVNFEVFKGAASQGTFAAAVTPELASLTKDTISVVTSYIPDAIGDYSITATVASDSVETDITDNSATTSFQVSECTYARDLNSAQAFYQLESGDFAGNLFDIYNDEAFSSIHVALGAGTVAGGTITGAIYEFTGFDPATGDPLFAFVDGSQTEEVTIFDTDLNAVNGNNFVCLPFTSPVTLNAGSVYLAAVAGTDVVRLPVSGSNVWAVSWVYTDADGTYGAASGVYMVRLVGQCAAGCSVGVEEMESNDLTTFSMPNPASVNTTINFNLNGSSNVTLTVRDITGKLVDSFNLGNRNAGNNTFNLNVSEYNAGVYTYTITSGNASATSKIVVE